MDPLSPTSAIVTICLTHFSTLSAILREVIIHFCTQGYLVGYTVGLCSNYAGPWPKHAMTEHFSGDLLATGLGNGSTMCARKAPKNSLFPLAYFLFMEMICQQFTLPGMPTVSTSWVCKRCRNVALRLSVLTPPQ